MSKPKLFIWKIKRKAGESLTALIISSTKLSEYHLQIQNWTKNARYNDVHNKLKSLATQHSNQHHYRNPRKDSKLRAQCNGERSKSKNESTDKGNKNSTRTYITTRTNKFAQCNGTR